MYPLKTKKPYNQANLAATANIFTTMYLGNYINWDFREWVWSHPGVDIVPQIKHDNIYACLTWVVHFAWFADANGNYIVLKHTDVLDPENFNSKTTLFSCHLHLSELAVKTWDSVKEWDIIWKSWNTWNSTWEHLHFQIDTKDAPFHPYWPFTFKESQAAWYWFFEAVNMWLWLDNAEKYTINPLVYLDKVAAKKWSVWISDIKVEHSMSAPTTTTTLITTQPVSVTKSKHFNDVKDDVEEIDYLYDKWVTTWYSDWSFRWESNISRAELLIMAYKFAWITPTWNWVDFKDVEKSDWYYKYIHDASSKKYISWYEDWTFKPNNPVTRADACAICLNIIIWKDKIPTASESDYDDVKVTDWYLKYTNYVAENWLLNSVWKFYPNDNMKRKDFAVLLYNLK